jgi:hypothetical protein
MTDFGATVQEQDRNQSIGRDTVKVIDFVSIDIERIERQQHRFALPDLKRHRNSPCSVKGDQGLPIAGLQAAASRIIADGFKVPHGQIVLIGPHPGQASQQFAEQSHHFIPFALVVSFY